MLRREFCQMVTGALIGLRLMKPEDNTLYVKVNGYTAKIDEDQDELKQFIEDYVDIVADKYSRGECLRDSQRREHLKASIRCNSVLRLENCTHFCMLGNFHKSALAEAIIRSGRPFCYT